MNKFYLLGGNGSCNAWWENVIPRFQHHNPIPVELPGFGNNYATPCRNLDELADYLLTHTQSGHAILATGVNALPALHAVRMKPRHFSRVVLLAPIGAYLWQRRLPRLMRSRPLRRMLHYLLSNHPGLFRRQFSKNNWTDDQYARMAAGYKHCRAFNSYWDIMQADRVLTLLEWINTPIELVWGGQDRIIDWKQSAAWSAILARAELNITFQDQWGHYPWIDQPDEFVEWLEKGYQGFPAHTKAGRLLLAQINGINVPDFIMITENNKDDLTPFLDKNGYRLLSVRSSGNLEDGADHSHAGQSSTFLRVRRHSVLQYAEELLATTETVVVQRYVEPVCSGVAFVRHLSAEVEWTPGHLQNITDGKNNPHRFILSRLPEAWRESIFNDYYGLTDQKLWEFFQQVVHIFHYSHCDIEWAWDGIDLQLLQIRPVTTHNWKRQLTAANIGEILPEQPSRLMEYAQQRAASSIPAVMARWDVNVLEDNEPFTALFSGASYINQDLFLARLFDWGLSSQRYANEIGGTAPDLPVRPWRFIRNLPVFWRMIFRSRQIIDELETELQWFDQQLNTLIGQNARAETLADWFCRFYVQVVQGNLAINAAIVSSGGNFWGNPTTVYAQLVTQEAAHRLPFESDPATPRVPDEVLPLQDFPRWKKIIQVLHKSGLPGMRGHYLQIREWYRDNLMRIFYRLHYAFNADDRKQWFKPSTHRRQHTDAFWQDNSGSQAQNSGFIIFPGTVEGVLGKEILLVDSLEPGLLQQYQQSTAVIARTGGRLSHGATLLRELGKPSAVLPQVDSSWSGKMVRFNNGQLLLLDEEKTGSIKNKLVIVK